MVETPIAAPSAANMHDWRLGLEVAIASAVNGTAPDGEEMARFSYVPDSVRITEVEQIPGLELWHLTVTYQVQHQEMAGMKMSCGTVTGSQVVKGRRDGTLDFTGVDFVAGLATD